MANQEQLEILKHGTEVWNKWRKENPSMQIDLYRADLSGAILRKVDLNGANLGAADLSRAILGKADLGRAYLSEARLREAHLSNAYLRGAVLRGAVLLGAVLSEADLNRADLREANLGKADLSGADLNGVDLRDARLRDTILRGTRLGEANLRRANLGGAYLRDADLSEADLSEADLSLTNLSGANLSRTDLNGVNFSGAYLNGADLSGALSHRTTFSDIDLNNASGLKLINHYGASSIGTDTFIRSKGKIPEMFLRGCGLSDWEIETVKLYNPDLSNEEINKTLYKMYDLRATQALQISPLFISYSHADATFVDRMERALNENGIRFWRDIHHSTSGPLEKQIDRAISQNPTLLVVLSRNSTRSDWVQHEVRKAREIEKDIGRHVLCPVRLDDTFFSSPWPEHIKEQVTEYNILDFSGWNDNEKFEKMLVRLIDGLNIFYKKEDE